MQDLVFFMYTCTKLLKRIIYKNFFMTCQKSEWDITSALEMYSPCRNCKMQRDLKQKVPISSV
jgi:hypothetical protein